MSRIHRRPGVDDDVFELAQFLIDRSEDSARRFVDAVQETMKDLAQMPGMGSRRDYNDAALAEVRSWRVKGFPNYLIYYVPLQDGIDVLAIMHGARDVERELSHRT